LKKPPNGKYADGDFNPHANAQMKILMQYRTKPVSTAAATNATARSFT
jgi:hypothetical protein